VASERDTNQSVLRASRFKNLLDRFARLVSEGRLLGEMMTDDLQMGRAEDSHEK
jgi:hypothetical protein